MAKAFATKLLSLVFTVAGVVAAQSAPSGPAQSALQPAQSAKPPFDPNAPIQLMPAPSRKEMPAPSAPTRKGIPEIAKGANGAILTIVIANNDKPIAQGTGFLVSQDGVIVTNYHVIANGNTAFVKFFDGTALPVDGVLAADKVRDLAIVKIHGKNFPALTLGNSDRVQIGEDVVAIGSPLGLERTVSNGILSGVRKDEEAGGKFLQITAPITHGSSGGPLFNMMGEVVGITTLGFEGAGNLNFAIPINDAKNLLHNQSATLQNLPNETPSNDPPVAKAPPNIPPSPREPSTKVIVARGTTFDQMCEAMKYCLKNSADKIRLPDGSVYGCPEIIATKEEYDKKCNTNPEDKTSACVIYKNIMAEIAPETRWYSDLLGGEFQIKVDSGLIRIITIRPPNETVLRIYHLSPASFSHDIILDIKTDAYDLGGTLVSHVECEKKGTKMVVSVTTLELHAVSDYEFVGSIGVADDTCEAKITPITFTSK